jgi:flavin-dependent dehydrogenase
MSLAARTGHQQRPTPPQNRDANVIVVGGGLAGAAAAKFASDANMSTLLIERLQNVGSKLCSEGTPTSIPGLDQAAFVVNQATSLSLYLDAELLGTKHFAHPIGYVVDRQRMARWLCAEAQSRDARILTGVRVVAVAPHAVRLASGAVYQSDYIVFADGTGSLARTFFDYDGYRTFVSLQYLVDRCRFADPEHFSLYVFSDDTGFGWIFPLGKHSAHVGVSGPGPLVRMHLEQITGGPTLDRGRRVSLRGARIPIGGMLPQIVDRRRGYLVCGDAAGQFLPLIGEGNRFAVASARCATQAIAHDDLAMYPSLFEPYSRMIDAHRAFFLLFEDATPELRRSLVRDFWQSIGWRWLQSHVQPEGAWGAPPGSPELSPR